MPEPDRQRPSLQFSVMCLNLIEEGGPPTLQYLFYELPLPELPYKMERFYVVNCWINGRGQFKQSIRILDPSKTRELVDTGEQPLILDDPSTPMMITNQVEGLSISETGVYWIQSYLDGNLVLQYPLTIRIAAREKKLPGVPVELQLPGDCCTTRFYAGFQ
jgi:hypothetical protein